MCEAFEGLEFFAWLDAVHQISIVGNINLNPSKISTCIAEVLDIPLPPP
jgi:hypothetical protein